LGAILYELLTGRPPFRASTPLDTLVKVLESEPTLPRQLNPTIPRKLELICLKCLDKSRERRYANAALLADDLDRYLRGEAVDAQPQKWLQRIVRWSRREPALASHLGVLCFSAGVVHVNYQLFHSTTLAIHLEVLGLLFVWALVSLGCQQALKWERSRSWARFAWSAADVIIFTFLLILTDNAAGPLVVGYSLFIAMSGLWFQKRVVWFTTAVAELAFAYLAANSMPREKILANPHHYVLFMISLLVQGFVMVYQVQRVRLLSRYYEARALE
jgi:serine/threonine-protein kinase